MRTVVPDPMVRADATGVPPRRAHRPRRGARRFLAIVAVVALAAAACGDDDDADAPPPGEIVRDVQREPCALLAATDIGDALDREDVPEGTDVGGQCTWTLAEGEPLDEQVALQVVPLTATDAIEPLLPEGEPLDGVGTAARWSGSEAPDDADPRLQFVQLVGAQGSVAIVLDLRVELESLEAALDAARRLGREAIGRLPPAQAPPEDDGPDADSAVDACELLDDADLADVLGGSADRRAPAPGSCLVRDPRTGASVLLDVVATDAGPDDFEAAVATAGGEADAVEGLGDRAAQQTIAEATPPTIALTVLDEGRLLRVTASGDDPEQVAERARAVARAALDPGTG